MQLSHDKIHARDCADCTAEQIEAAGPNGRIDFIKIDVQVGGPLDDEQVARLLEIFGALPGPPHPGAPAEDGHFNRARLNSFTDLVVQRTINLLRYMSFIR